MLEKGDRFHWLLSGLLFLGVAFALEPGATVAEETAILVAPPIKPPFFVRSYGGKCLDFGPPPQVSGSPVFIYDCNGTIAQQVRIEEVNGRHDVILRAGNKVIGVKPLNFPAAPAAPAAGVASESEMSLELQNEANPLTVLFTRQVFALDGDSIIFASNRNLVFKVQNGRGTNRTPIVLGHRDLADSEFWTFTATDGAAWKLTNGFVRVPQESEFGSAILQATWGTVIEVDPDASIDLQREDRLLSVAAGVTIRGDRHGVRPGAEISSPYKSDSGSAATKMLVINGDYVRITGLRMRGPSRGRDHNLRPADGIYTDSAFNSIIDHNDMSEWTNAAVEVDGGNDPSGCTSLYPPSRPEKVHVVRNFLHHNERWGSGYGVVMSRGGYASIEGNTFVSNRHAIADDGSALSGYRAWFNLVLTDVPTYSGSESDTTLGRGPQQDFDMHGSDPSTGSLKEGGLAGAYVEIARNTFLATNRHNFDLRGTPCYLAEFHNNVMRESLRDSIRIDGDPSKLIVTDDNQFAAGNPTDRLGVGDFDGDGLQDLFLATGAAWYYAPAGNAEWRFLSAHSEGIGSLLFGDFDGDGRTDVLTQHGRDWLVSWGGVSQWEKINESDAWMSDFAIGDFNGDHRADVFYADGVQWYVSYGGVSSFTPLDVSGFRIADLRFGDFNADGRTDVFSVVSGQWMVAYSGTSGWKPLRVKLTDSVADLTVADFNGDGRADIARSSCSFFGSCDWQVSYRGTGNWTKLRSAGLPLTSAAAIGRFSGNVGVDVLLWHDNYLDIASAGAGASVRQSRQDMR